MIVATFAAMIPGAVYRVQWVRSLKLRKAFAVGYGLSKAVSALVKVGMDYDNKASVQAKRESGELPATNAGLPWGTWFEFPRIITHNGNFYLRFYPATTDASQTSAEYYLATPTGTGACDTATARQYALASEFRDTDAALECFTIKLANLVALERITPKRGNELTPTTPGFEHSFLSRVMTPTIAEHRHD